MYRKWPQTPLNGRDGGLYSSCVTCSKSQRSSGWEMEAGRRNDGKVREEAVGVMDDDDWGMMKRPWDVSLILLSGVAFLSLGVTSGLPPDLLLLCGPRLRSVATYFNEGIQECFLGMDRNSRLPVSHFTLIHIIQHTPTTGTHAPPPLCNHTASRTLTLNADIFSKGFCYPSWPCDHFTYYAKWSPQKEVLTLSLGSQFWWIHLLVWHAFDF